MRPPSLVRRAGQFIRRWIWALALVILVVGVSAGSYFTPGVGAAYMVVNLASLLVGLGLAFAAVRWTVMEWANAIRAIWPLLPLTGFFISLFLIGVFADTEGTDAFHGAAAQIIPILVLALAVEGRAFRIHETREPTDILAASLTLVLLAIGEFYALRSVYTGIPGSGDSVAASIVAGFIGIGALALSGPPDDTWWNRKDSPTPVKKPEERETGQP